MCLFCFGCGMCGKPQSPQMSAYFNRPKRCLKCDAELDPGATECVVCGAPAVLEAGMARSDVGSAQTAEPAFAVARSERGDDA